MEEGPTEIDREELRSLLEDVAKYFMPFGKYGPDHFPPNGVPLCDLPPEYLLWFADKGFPIGRLGELMEAVHHLKMNGCDFVFDPIRKKNGGRVRTAKRRPSTDFEE